MKQTYQQPTLSIVIVAVHGNILDASPVTHVSGNACLEYGGGNSQAARVKQDNYNVWDDDWSE